MNLKSFGGAALAAALLAVGAQAATITNNETKPQTVKVLSADRSKSFTINPSDTVTIDQVLCPQACVLALPNGDEFEFVSNDELILDQGAVFSNPPLQGSVNEPAKQPPQ